jgi:hypothetical protein
VGDCRKDQDLSAFVKQASQESLFRGESYVPGNGPGNEGTGDRMIPQDLEKLLIDSRTSTKVCFQVEARNESPDLSRADPLNRHVQTLYPP